MESPINYFSNLTDPRVERTKDHLLDDIIFIAIAAVICGAESWNDMENYGKSKESWLKGFLQLPNGIPSHDTFNRVFSTLDPQELEKCFLDWVKSVAQITKGEVISIDGKSIRGSKEKGSKSIVHMVSAWANANHMVLGQVKVDEKSNEITAIPRLLEVLVLEGCIVTIDAMGCQKEIAKKIIKKGADYILAVKGNQGSLEEGVKDTVRFAKPFDKDQHVDTGHGRIETRRCYLYSDFSHIEEPSKWKDLKAIVKIEAERYIKSTGQTQKEIRLYITSCAGNAKMISSAIRAHWGVENSLHWVLDVSFGEDASRKRDGHSAQNFSILNRIALNLVKNEQSKKRSVKGKRLDAGWDNDYLLKIMKN
jgi:predicted transposase YbfD/YdcC